MDNQQIITYIQQCFQQGYTEADLRLQLANNGWPQESIDQAFRDYYVTTIAAQATVNPIVDNQPAPSEDLTPKQSFPKWLFAIPALTFILIELALR